MMSRRAGSAEETLFHESGALRRQLASLGAAALTQLLVVLLWPQERRDALMQLWMRRPERADLARLIGMADSDESITLLLQAIRDLLS
jgi:hypothetical protein